MKYYSFFILLILLLERRSSFAQPGILDTTFNDDGIATCFTQGGAFSIAIQSDGKIILCGAGNGANFGFARFNPDGSLDPSFSLDGLFVTFVGNSPNYAHSVAIQPDGKIVAGGTCDDNTGKICFALLRINSNGTIDNTFGDNGEVITSFNAMGYGDNGYAIALQPDGKIIEVGRVIDNFGTAHFGVARFDTDGTLDNSFGSGGKVMTDIGNPVPSAKCVAIQPDGKILVGGYSEAFQNTSFAIVRYNPDGSLDNSFNGDGKDTAYFGIITSSAYDYGNDIVLQSDGKIVLTGYSFHTPNPWGGIPLIRYNQDGTRDNNFGIAGKDITLIDSFGLYGTAIAVQQDDKILVGGYTYYDLGGYANNFLVARYHSNGEIDSSFGVNGMVISSITPNADDAYSMALQQDNKILLAGTSDLGFTVARYLSGLEVGILDFTKEEFPILIYPNPIESEAVLQYELTQSENLSIVLYDVQGRLVQSFITNENRATGKHGETLHFNEMLAAGNYILSIGNGFNSQGVKIVKQNFLK